MAGVDPATVAEWAGYSVDVPFDVYAAFLDGGEAANRARIEKILGHEPLERLRGLIGGARLVPVGTHGEETPVFSREWPEPVGVREEPLLA